MNDLINFLNALNQSPLAQNQTPDPGTDAFTKWLLNRPQVPSYGGKSGGGTSGMGTALTGLMNGSGQAAGAEAANAGGAGLLSSL